MTMTATKQLKRDRRHKRVRARVSGTAERPRLCVYKSNTRLIAQIIDDTEGKTLAAISSSSAKGGTPREKVLASAAELAKAAKDKGVTAVVFDRGGFNYTGTIKAFADAVREAGLTF